jgi:nicotinamidase-related amidase
VVGFRNGLPEIGAHSAKSFAGLKDRLASMDMAQFAAVHEDIKPADGEVVVVKKRVSAFAGSDLEVMLRAYDIKHMVLAGIATGGVVLSTVREAADKDYRLTVLADCCADQDAEVHEVLLTKIFPRQTDVLTVDEWTK